MAAARRADLADERGDHERAQRWRAGADEIKAEVLDKGVLSKGIFRQEYEGNFPQAFSHLALIEATSLLIESEPENGPPPAI